MIQEGFKRKLCALLSADVQGYSRLMGEDEDETIRTLTTYRELMSTIIQKHRGRVVDSPGDNLLAEFGSVVDAVGCAVEIQEELRVRNAELPDNRRMEFRIGINLGDVVEEGDRIYGDGVNITARIEGLADAGGISISRSVYDQVKGKLNFSYEYLGEHTVKNMEDPVRVYRVEMGAKSIIPVILRGANLPEKPSIAVLPFANMSDDPEQEYFSDGITEDIITDLSKISALFVISRNSVFTYKGKAVKVEEVGKELGVRYILEGSVRKAMDRVRITAQLVDATTGGHLWAERYDRKLEDIFALQDEVTQEIVSVLAVKLTEDEKTRRACKCQYTCNTDAYDYFLRGLEYFHGFTEKNNVQAREMFKKAVQIDPGYALACTMLGHTHLVDWTLGWDQDAKSIERAFELAQKSIAIDDSLAEPHELLGNVYLWKKQHEQAIAELERAISLDPNNADWLAGLGGILAWADRAEEAIEIIKKAMSLNPIFPPNYLWNLGHAFVLAERFDEAISTFKRAITQNPDFWPSHILLTASYSAAGRMEEARAEAAETLRINPDFSLESWRLKCPFKNKEILERRFSMLRKAGLK